MNKKIEKIIDALEHHEDTESISVLEELGTNSSDNEVRERTAQALVRKNVPEALKVVITNQGKGINDLNPVVAMSTVNEILNLEDKTEVIKDLADTVDTNETEDIRDNAQSVKSLLTMSE